LYDCISTKLKNIDIYTQLSTTYMKIDAGYNVNTSTVHVKKFTTYFTFLT